MVWESNPQTMQYSLNKLPLSHSGNRPGGNFHFFNLHAKAKNAKIKTNTDGNPTTNPNLHKQSTKLQSESN